MPIYEYRCAACGFQKEYLQKMSAAPLTECPERGKASFAKMVTAAGFHLKGSGWYATDFKHGTKPKAPEHTPPAKSDEPSAAKPNEQPTAKSEQQSAAKSDDKSSPQTKPAQEAPARKSDEPAPAKTSGASRVSS